MIKFDPGIEIRIRQHFKKFLDSRFKSIEELSIDDFELNPFLIACIKNQINLKTQNDLARWLVRQRVERGFVTGFGLTLQKIAKEFSSEKPLPGLTMKLKKSGKTYNLMIKSGPNPYPMQPAMDMEKILLDTKKIEPDSIPLFCMCYGDENSVSNIVKKYMNEVKYLVGKNFWEFISGDNDCENKILNIAKEIGTNYKDIKGNSLHLIIENKVKYVEKQLKNLFGEDQKSFWNNILNDVYL